MRRRPTPARGTLFPVNVWPPMVDALTLVLAAFVLLMVVVAAAQRGTLVRLREREQELERMRAEKERAERRLRSLAQAGVMEVEEGKVILQGEVLFPSGSDALTAAGGGVVQRMAPALASVLQGEPDQMVMVGGHTDDVPIHNDRFDSNWELSTARAVSVARMLVAAGLPAARVAAAGFGPHHPRVAAHDGDARRKNRRIEVLLVPIHSVASR